MGFILLSVVASTCIMLIFKISVRLKVEVFQLVVLNYFIASGLGIWYWHEQIPSFSDLLHKSWLPWAILIACMFVGMFLVIGHATRKVGVSVTTVATKMSVVFPIVFSLFFDHEVWYFSKILGIALALVAVYLTVSVSDSQSSKSVNWLITLALFVGAGSNDVLVKFVQTHHLQDSDSGLFSGILFFFCAIVASVVAIIRREKVQTFFNFPTLGTASLLGLMNFASLYFLLKALSDSAFESSVVFGLVNIGTVCFAVWVSFFILKETLHLRNWIGVGFSIVAFLILGFLH